MRNDTRAAQLIIARPYTTSSAVCPRPDAIPALRVHVYRRLRKLCAISAVKTGAASVDQQLMVAQLSQEINYTGMIVAAPGYFCNEVLPRRQTRQLCILELRRYDACVH